MVGIRSQGDVVPSDPRDATPRIAQRRQAATFGSLLLLAILLCLTFLEYRVQETRAAPDAPDYIPIPKDMIVWLGYTSLPPEPGSDLERYNGRIDAERGIYARSPYPRWVSVLGGVVLPLILLASRTVSYRRWRRSQTSRGPEP